MFNSPLLNYTDGDDEFDRAKIWWYLGRYGRAHRGCGSKSCREL